MSDETRVYEDCNFWKIRACKGMTTNNCWNTQCPDHNVRKDYSWISTKELVEELAKREGVTHHIVNPDQKWYLCIDHIDDLGYQRLCYAGGDTGAARILVVVD